MSDTLRLLAIGAHPDDCDFGAAGLAAIHADSGHQVRFVSMTNGDAGHQSIGGAPLARRRLAEAQAAARVAGIEYIVLDTHDGELEPTLANRKTVVRLIREFAPDMLLTHRPNDYHPDHRYTAQLVQDAAYTVTVPGSVALTPHLAVNPLILYMSDQFQRPYPFQADIVIDIDAVIDLKIEMLFQHASQVFEWLPFNERRLEQVPDDPEARRVWLSDTYAPQSARLADQYRDRLVQLYGREHGTGVRHAEAFEVSEYGSPLTTRMRKRLFPFLE